MSKNPNDVVITSALRTPIGKYKGSLKNTVEDYLGGLRSTCTYINAKGMKQMAKCTTFLRVTQQLNTTLQS